jgi:protein-disulfide isomerase
VEIREELRAIKALLTKAQPPSAPMVNIKGVEFELGAGSVRGARAARLTLVEITDYQCPYCGRYSRETFPEILKQYVEGGIIRYAIIDLPLPIHKMAFKAAEAYYCAGDQGKFWEMHDQIMSNQEYLNDLSAYATSLSLDVAKCENCLETGKYTEMVGKNVAIASKLKISGVPGFILAQSIQRIKQGLRLSVTSVEPSRSAIFKRK